MPLALVVFATYFAFEGFVAFAVFLLAFAFFGVAVCVVVSLIVTERTHCCESLIRCAASSRAVLQPETSLLAGRAVLHKEVSDSAALDAVEHPDSDLSRVASQVAVRESANRRILSCHSLA